MTQLKQESGRTGIPPYEDEQVRALLRESVWPVPSDALHRRLQRPDSLTSARRMSVEMGLLAATVGVVAILAVLMVARLPDTAQDAPPPSTTVSGWLLATTVDVLPQMVAINAQSLERRHVSDLSKQEDAGAEASNEDAFVQSPLGSMVAQLEWAEENLGEFHLSVRGLSPIAPVATVVAPGEERKPTSFVWSPLDDGILYVASIRPGPPEEWTKPTAFELHQVELSIVDERVVVDGDQVIWHMRTEEPLPLGVDVVGWDRSRNHAALVIRDSSRYDYMMLLDLNSGETKRIALSSRYMLEKPSPDGRFVVHAECAGTASPCQATESMLRIVEVASGRVVDLPASGPDWRIGGLAWSRDSQKLAWTERQSRRDPREASVNQSRLRVAVLENGAFSQPVTMLDRRGSMQAIAFSPNGNHLVVDESGDAGAREGKDGSSYYAIYHLSEGSTIEIDRLPKNGDRVFAWVGEPGPASSSDDVQQ